MRQVQFLEVKVGLLVVAGLVVTVALVMTADKFRVQRTYQVTAYLRDAGGLRFDSPVTLSGIAVGKVTAIEFVVPGASAPGSVRAAVEIFHGVVLPAEVQARLATSGVFGDSSLALSAPAKASGVMLPVDGSATLVVQPGFFDQAADKAGGILAAVEDLLDAQTRADTKRLVANAADLAGHAAVVLAKLEADQVHLSAILANLDTASGEFKTAMATLNTRLDPLLTRADSALVKFDDLLTKANTSATSVETLMTHVDSVLGGNEERIAALLTAVAGAAIKAQRIAEALEGGEGVLGQLLVNRNLAEDLQHVAVDLESAAKQVADKPSRLVFDDSDSERHQDKAARNREKMRRTLAEGLGQPAAPISAGSPARTPAPGTTDQTPSPSIELSP